MLPFEIFSSKISSLKVFKGNLNDSTGKSSLSQTNILIIYLTKDHNLVLKTIKRNPVCSRRDYTEIKEEIS